MHPRALASGKGSGHFTQPGRAGDRSIFRENGRKCRGSCWPDGEVRVLPHPGSLKLTMRPRKTWLGLGFRREQGGGRWKEDGGAHCQCQETITSCLILYMKSKCENGVWGAVQKREGVRTRDKNRSSKEGTQATTKLTSLLHMEQQKQWGRS